MTYNSFYGISALQLIMLNIPKNKLNAYIKPYNNVIDYYRISDLKRELVTLKKVLTEGFIYEYPTKKLKKMSRDLNKYKKNPNESKLTEEEVKEYEEELSKVNAEITYCIYTESDVSPEQAKVIRYFMDREKVIDRYINSIEDKVFNEKKLFGYKFSAIARRNLPSLMYTFYNDIKNTSKVNVSQLYDRYREDIKYIKSLSTQKSKEDIMLETMRLSDDVSLDNINEETRIMKKYIQDKNKSSSISNMENMNLLLEMYNTIRFIDEDFYNSMFDLNLNKEQYMELFDSLLDMGLIGLNFECIEMFKQFATCITFSQEGEIEINRNSDLYKAVIYLDRYLNSVRKVGDIIEYTEDI